MTNMKEFVSNHICNMFYQIQTEHNITDGDIGIGRTFELDRIENELAELLNGYIKEATTPMFEIIGFVFKHDDEDYEYWETDAISEEDQQKIWEILMKYSDEGSSVRNVYEKISTL